MFKKRFFLTLFALVCGLSGAARAEPIDVDNFSFEYDVNGELITEQTNITNVLDWTVRDMSDEEWATAWIFAVVEWGDSYEPADGNVVLINATTHDPCYPVEFYQILDDAEAIIAENRRYTLIFNSINSSVIDNPDVNGLIFYSAGGTEGEGNDVILASREVELASPTWGQPGYSGMEEIKVSYTALSGADSIGERLGIKFRVPVHYPWLEGVFVGFDNVRVEWSWATDAWEPSPADGAEDVLRDVTLSWRPGVWAQSTDGHEVYFGTSFDDVDNATTSTSGVFQGAQDGNSWSVLDYDANGLDLGGIYYWRIDEVNETYSGTTPPPPPDGRWKGEVWSFVATGRATNPIPADGSKGVPVSTLLSWTPGTDSNSHDVYIGIDRGAVDSAGTGDEEWKGNYDYDVNTYDPDPLSLGTTYYWRIDEINSVTVKGKVWSFTTRNYKVVDDMDSYADSTNYIYDTWLDYWTIGSGAEVFLNMDANFVRDGNSMWYAYNNTRKDPNNNYGSVAKASVSDLEIGPDWTANEAKALSLYFYGVSGNSATLNDRMYVALQDGSANVGVVYHPDVNTLAEEGWHEWNINLQDYNDAGVDMTDISKVALGLGVYGGGSIKGGKGDLYFDDFRLYSLRCMPDLVSLVGDIDSDCAVDGYDLAIMARDWLLGDYAATPSIPQVDPVVWYMFDANTGTEVGARVANSGTYGDVYDMNMGYFIDEDGEPYIDADRIPSWTTDVAPPPDACDPNYALDFSGETDGTGDFLDFPAFVDFNSNTVTITAWIKPGAGIQGSGDPELGTSGYTGLINCRAPNTVSAGLHYGGEWGGNWAWNGQLAYTWNDDDEYTWGFYSDLLIPELEWSFIAVAVEPTKATLCLSDGISINFSENVMEHEPEEFDGRTRIGADPGDDKNRCFRGLMDDVRIYDVTLTQNELMGLAEASYIPLVSPANLYDEELMYDKHVNLRDFAILADNWLAQQLWP